MRGPLALALAFCTLTGGAVAQGMLMPAPEERTVQDCPDCPRLVVLPSGLLMSQTPVTRGEFAVFARATGFSQPRWGCKWQAPAFDQKADHPVVCVSFDDAEAYLTWLTKVGRHAYRVPTVAEMRGAAMGGQTGNYWWGQSIGRNRANCTGCGSPFDGKGTSPVETFAPNPFHLSDAVGNVWIWTSDCGEAGCQTRQLIGGGWANPPADLRVSRTIWNEVEIPFNTYGIRVVRDPDPTTTGGP